MWDFIFWTLAIYGLIEIIKYIFNLFTFTKLKSDGIYVIIAVKNQENKIEGFLRSFLFRTLYCDGEIKNVIITDLNSTDDTPKIIEKIQKENQNVFVSSWKECKDVIENIKNI